MNSSSRRDGTRPCGFLRSGGVGHSAVLSMPGVPAQTIPLGLRSVSGDAANLLTSATGTLFHALLFISPFYIPATVALPWGTNPKGTPGECLAATRSRLQLFEAKRARKSLPMSKSSPRGIHERPLEPFGKVPRRFRRRAFVVRIT